MYIHTYMCIYIHVYTVVFWPPIWWCSCRLRAPKKKSPEPQGFGHPADMRQPPRHPCRVPRVGMFPSWADVLWLVWLVWLVFFGIFCWVIYDDDPFNESKWLWQYGFIWLLTGCGFDSWWNNDHKLHTFGLSSKNETFSSQNGFVGLHLAAKMQKDGIL